MPILYLPRSYTPRTIAPPPLFGNRASLLPEDEGMRELYLTPKSMPKGSKNKQSPNTDVQAKVRFCRVLQHLWAIHDLPQIALPFPLVAASGDRIPFVLTIHSQSPALAALYTTVTLQLVKITKIKAYEKTSVKETIISSGEVYDAEQRGDGVQVLRGELGNGAPGVELSWSAAGLIEMRVRTPAGYASV